MLTKNAFANIKNRYLAVLKKCRLMNVFGNLTMASNLVMAGTLAMAVTAPLAMPSDALAETQVNISNSIYTVYDYLPDADTSYTLTSSLSKTGATDYYIGLYAGGATNTSVNITIAKDGSVTITTPEGHAVSSYLYGIYANRTTNAIINNGTITVSAQTQSDSVPASANAYGMSFGPSSASNVFTNNGTITVSATTQTGGATAYGTYVDTANASNVFTNNGIITATATSENSVAGAYGMFAYGVNNKLVNNGTITVTAISQSTHSVSISAIGISASGTDFNEVTNYGIINVTATSASPINTDYTSATGMEATGTNNELTNYGTINVTATADTTTATAYGMSGNATTSTLLNNYGIITVSATATNADAYAYQTFVTNGTASIGTWNLLLGEEYSTDSAGGTGYYVFGVSATASSTAKLVFGTTDADGNVVSGSTFNVYGISTPSDDGLYSIAAMVYVDSTASATGYIENVTSSYSFLDVALVDSTGKAFDLTTTSDETWKSQYIKASLNITTETSPVHATTATTLSSLTSTMAQLSTILADNLVSPPTAGKSAAGKGTTMYADAGTTATTFTDAGGTAYVSQDDAIWETFLTPYYSRNSHNDGLYTVRGLGLAMGASRAVTDNFDLGFHFNLASSLGDSELADSDALSYTLGMHGIYHMDQSLYVRGQVSAFLVESDIRLLSNAAGDLYADTDMHSYGMYAQLAAGYHVMLSPKHVLTPELAVSSLYAHMDGYDTQFRTATGGLGNELSMKSEDYAVFYADASLRWTGTFDVEKGVVKPTVKAGLRQALSDPEMASTMEIFGTSATTHSDLNNTAFICEAGLDWELGDVTLSATYAGEFGDEEHSHAGMFKAMWEF